MWNRSCPRGPQEGTPCTSWSQAAGLRDWEPPCSLLQRPQVTRTVATSTSRVTVAYLEILRLLACTSVTLGCSHDLFVLHFPSAK